EGGCAATTDLRLATRIATALNFGFHNSRSCEAQSINGKLSEYHAAVGLAELDGWAGKKAAFAAVAGCYHRLGDAAGLGARLLTSPVIASSYVLFYCDDATQSAQVQTSLEAHRVGYRLWYGGGLHHHPHLAACARDELRVTKRVAPCVLGLPSAPDLDEASITRVIAALAEGREHRRLPDDELKGVA